MVRNNDVVVGRWPGKRYVRSGAALVAGASLLATFGGLAPASAAAAQVVHSGRSAAASGGTLVIGDTSSVQKLDPDVVTNFLDFQALGLVYDQLVQYNSKSPAGARLGDQLGLQQRQQAAYVPAA